MLKHKANARFVYFKQKVSQLDIAECISQIDLLISKTQKMHRAHDDIILNFQEAIESEEFQNSLVFIGREVIGYDQEILSLIQYIDTQEREVHRENLKATSDFSSLLQECASKLPLGKVKWSLIIQDHFSNFQLEY